MNVTQHSQRVLEVLAGSERLLAASGRGTMTAHRWNRGGGEVVILCHGGSGSWTHFIRNIPALTREFDVIALDLPGLGGSASLPKGYKAADAGAIVTAAISSFIGDTPCHLVGFSWGAAVSAMVAAKREGVKSAFLIGPASLGIQSHRSNMQPLVAREPGMDLDAIWAANRENLARLMLHDPTCIDDFAVYLQVTNTDQSHFFSPQFARDAIVLDGIRVTRAPVKVVFGDHDAPAYPHLELRRERVLAARPDAEFELIHNAGHWAQYEASDVVNRMLRAWILAHS